MIDSLYVEALLVEPDLADQVYDLWNAELISGDFAALAWAILAMRIEPSSTQ